MAPAPADNSPELMSDLEPTVCRWLWLDVPPGASERSLAVQQPLQPHVPLPTLSPEVTSSPGHPGVRHGGRRASAAPSEHPHGAGGAALASFPGFATTRRAGALTPVPLAVLGHKALGTAVVQGAEHRAARPGSRAQTVGGWAQRLPQQNSSCLGAQSQSCIHYPQGWLCVSFCSYQHRSKSKVGPETSTYRFTAMLWLWQVLHMHWEP